MRGSQRNRLGTSRPKLVMDLKRPKGRVRERKGSGTLENSHMAEKEELVLGRR